MPRYRLMLGLTFLIGLGLASPAAADTSLAVLGVEGSGVPAELVQQITDALRQRAAITAGIRMLPAKDLVEMKLVFGCDAELPGCMAQAGKSLGAEKLLYGSIKRAGGKVPSVLVNLYVLDVSTGSIEKSLSEKIARRDLRTDMIESIALHWWGSLIDIRTTATLTVLSDPPDASLSMDGQPVGRTPAMLNNLQPGVHTLTFALAGRLSAKRTVELRPGGTHELQVALESEAQIEKPKPRPVEPPPPSMVDTKTPVLIAKTPPKRTGPTHSGRATLIVGGCLLGAAAVLVVASAASYAHALDDEDRTAYYAPTVRTNAASANAYNAAVSDGRSSMNAVNGLTGAYIALAAGGAVALGIGIYQRLHPSKEEKIAGRHQSWYVAPTLGRDGNGATAGFKF